jgi:hypothetical protein
LGLLAAVAGVGCGGANEAAEKVAVAPPPVTCARQLPQASTPKPVSLPRTGSTVALARLGDKTIAYVADEDDHAVRVVDVDGAELSSVPLDGRPSQLLFSGDGRLLVGIRDKAEVEVLEPTADLGTAALAKRCVVPTDAEPVGLALLPDDSQLFVTTGWGHSLAGYDAKSATMARTFVVSLPREPRSVVASDDGKQVFVSHAVGGDLSIIDLDVKRVLPMPLHPSEELLKIARKKKGDGSASPLANFRFSRELTGSSCQGFALAKTSGLPSGRVFAPQVLVDPGDPNQRPTGYGNPRVDQTEVADVAVLDANTADVLLSSLEPPDSRLMRSFRSDRDDHNHEECLLPRAAAFDKDTGSLLVGCFGIDSIVEYDALAASPSRAEKRRWSVAAGPTGIAIDPEKKRAIVWSQFEHVVSRVALDGPEIVDEKTAPPPKVGRIALAEKVPLSLAFELGRVLFHMVGDERISHDGRACASCHPDGRDDSLVWATPNGPRRSISLAGKVADTAPFSWSGTEHDLKEHMGITFQRLKGEGGLKSMELDALAVYVETMIPAPNPHETSEKIARGKAIFQSEAAGCSFCHAGDSLTDNKHHDVQSKTQFDHGSAFNTPSLKFVGGGGPYFHDGRYKTLHQLLTDADRKMGYTKHLKDEDLEALEAYLRSL